MRANAFFIALKSPYRLFKFIKNFMGDIGDFALKDKYRRKRKSTYSMLMDSKVVGGA
jgi:hypothetical protein